MFDQRRALIFIAKAFLIILVFSAVWPFIIDSYASWLASATDVVAPSSIKIIADEGLIFTYFKDDSSPLILYSLPFQGGFLLVIALIIATPGIKIISRLISMFLSAIIIFALQIVTLLVVSLNRWAVAPVAVLFLSIGIDLFPVLIWLALSAKYWWPGRQTAPTPI